MKPKLLLNLILLAILAALAAVALLEPGKEKAETVYLTAIDTEALARFELDNGEKLVFEKRGGHWWLSAPFAAPANDIRIRQLLAIANAESKARYPLKPEDLPKFDLAKPKAALALGQTRLAFGGHEPIDMLRYVQIGDTLHLVADDFAHHLAAKAVDYVDKKLLPEDAKLREVKLPGLSATLGEKGQWTMDPPGEAAAMAELATAWQSARAIEVKRREQPAPGEPVHIAMGGGQAVDFVITQREPDLLLVRPDWKLEYMVPGEAGKRLLSLQKPGVDEEKVDGAGEEESESPLGGPDGGEDIEYGPGEDAEPDAD